jgi:hypothetical protein
MELETNRRISASGLKQRVIRSGAGRTQRMFALPVRRSPRSRNCARRWWPFLRPPSWRWRRGRQGRRVEKRGLQNEHDSRAGAVTRVTRPARPQNTPWRMSLATRRSTAALSLSGCSASSLCCGPQRRNSFEHFGDEKLRLKLCHVLGYDVSISAQTKRSLRIARRLARAQGP